MSNSKLDRVCQNVGLANSMKATLEIGVRRQAGLLVLAPVGRIDNLTSAEFQTRLLGAVRSGSADVVVDFSGVEYISSCGLHTLMTASLNDSREQGSGPT
jgi:anti-sigma B factor antagonist/stage II sporulation protein AA (anti-sigma F factor antagonist)